MTETDDKIADESLTVQNIMSYQGSFWIYLLSFIILTIQ